MDALVNDNDKPVLVYATFPSLESAEKVASQLIEAEIAACVNILPGMIAIYSWQGEVQRDEEVVLLAKTRSGCEDEVRAAIVSGHTYDVPAIFQLDISDGHPPYLEWIMAQTGGAK